MMKRILLSLIFIGSIYSQLFAQADSIPVKDFQLTFFYPLGTGGTNSINSSYDVSLNLLFGQTGATESFEAGGFLNINRYYSKGAQLSGFINLTGTKQTKDHHSSGFQGAGFINVNNTKFKGAQVAGFINTANHSLSGAQVAGFINYSTNSLSAVQVAGFVNVASKGLDNAQVAGFVNYAPKIEGAQVAGFVNNTLELENSAQIAGFVNSAVKVDTASQIAGFVNVAAKGQSNAQIAGFINVADKVKGAQIAGFINVCDSIDGVPIALVSIVRKNGFRSFELSSSDFSIAQASFKMGVRHFYNVYTISKLPEQASRWSFGGGFGYQGMLNEKLKVNVEATIHQELWVGDKRAPKSLYIDRTNLVNQLKVGIGIPLGSAATFNIAPTFNIGVAQSKQNPLGENIQAHWKSTLSSHTVGNKKITTWFGFSSGFSF